MAVVPPGTKFGPYEVIDHIGTGGMGEVYRARDSRMRRDVALKIIRSDSITPDRIRRFEQEARTSAALNHPNIVTVHDVGETGGVPYLVCELLQGETLRDRLRGPLPTAQAVDIAIQIARGLTAAHDRGVVHRDLKPENLFLTRDGVVKLMDFGIAKLRSSADDDSGQQTTLAQTEAGAIVGTAAYMSPEQVAGKAVDHRADIFSLGVVLYEMLCGARPFGGATSAETMAAIMRDAPGPLPSHNPNLSLALDRIVGHCLEKNPSLRFQSAGDVAFALEALSGSTTTSGISGKPVAASTKPARSWWWLAPAGAVAGAAIAYAILARPATDDTPRFSRVIRLSGSDLNENTPALSPDGKWIAYIGETKGRADVYVRFLNGGEPINLTGGFTDLFVGQRGDIGGLDISPDGSQIAFQAGPKGSITSSQSTYLVSAPLGGSARKFVDRVAGLRWAPNGKQIVYVRAGGSAGDSLVVADATGENAREIVPVSGGLHTHWPAWSADNKYIYYSRSIVTGNSEPTEIFRIPAAGGASEKVLGTSRRAVYPFPTADGHGMVFSANPSGAELSLYWQPLKGGEPVRLTTGVGEYAQPRVSADGHTMVAVVYEMRRSLESIAIAHSTSAATSAPVTSAAGGDIDPSFSAASNRLAFASGRTGGRNIWTSALDGTDAKQVTSGADIDERPSWSSDGTLLAFVSSRGGVRSIWTVPRDGGVPSHVVDAQVLDVLTWSPDGREIAFAAPDGDVPHLFRVSVAGGTPQRIVTPGPAVAPSWSASKNLIAYLESRRAPDAAPNIAHIILITPEGRVAADFISKTPTLSNGMVAWSHDGRSVAAYADPGGALGSLWLIDVDQQSAHLVIELPQDRRFRGMTWAPGNDRIIFGVQQQISDLVLFDQAR